jgi:predicted ATPase/DNA-binding SARP family transcriptional activator
MGLSLDSDELRIHLLGGFRVWVGPHAIGDSAWRLRKSKAIVKLLALTPGCRLHRDHILDILWPDLPADAAANNLHQTLHAARRTLSSGSAANGKNGALSLSGQILTLGPSRSIWVDVEAFRRAADATKKSRNVHLFEQAIGLYSGDLLPEDRYEDWIAEHRDNLSQDFRSLYLNLASLNENARHLPAAITALEELVRHDPADEDTHVRLMRLYAQIGQRDQSLTQYRRLQEALRRDLNVAPQPSTVRLFEDIRADRFPPVDTRPAGRTHRATAIRTVEPPRHRSHAARKGPEAPPGNLPAPLTAFVGRERDLAALRDLLAKGRLLTLTGAGGSGKTRLALELAAGVRDQLSDGAWWVDLQSVRDEAPIPYVVASALGLRDQRGRSMKSLITERLRHKELLVVLDNCEHLVAGCAALAESLLKQCPGLRIVVTSRERLGLVGETRWPVPPLAVPPCADNLSAAEILRFESSRLFVDRCRDVRPDFALSESDARVMAKICRQMDGLPLLIELIAARTHALSLEQIRDRLADRLSLLKWPGMTASRYKTVVEAIDWSYNLLSEDEQLLLNRLAVFAGTFTMEGAQGVCTDNKLFPERIFDALPSLVDKSMVVVEEGRGGAVRYRLLETIRQYSLERLEQSGEAEHIRVSCFDWYLHLAELTMKNSLNSDQFAWFKRLEDEHANFRALLAWAHGRDVWAPFPWALPWCSPSIVTLGSRCIGPGYATAQGLADIRSLRGLDLPGAGPSLRL